MGRTITTHCFVLLCTVLYILLCAGPTQAQDQGNPWKQVQDILKVEFPKLGFYPKDGAAFGSMPYNLLGQFFYGDKDGSVSLTLPLWVDKPDKGEDRNAVVRSGDITKEYSEYPVVFSLYRLGAGQTARAEIEKSAARFAHSTNPGEEWKEDVITNHHLYWRESIKEPFAWQRKDVTYHECPGYRIQLYAQWDIFELQAVFRSQTNSLFDMHKKVRRPATMQTFAGFEFAVSENERYCILCTTSQRNNIHSHIPYASGYAIDNPLTTIASALAHVFKKSNLLDREISQAAFEQLRSKVEAMYAGSIDEKVAAALKEGVVARLVNFDGTVVRDPGCGEPYPVTYNDVPLKVGDWLRTGPQSHATVVFLDPEMQWYHRSAFFPPRESDGADGAFFNIGENSEIHFADFFRENADTPLKTSIVSVIKGWVRYVTRGWKKRSIFSVKAGHNLLNMRGTDVIVSHIPDRELSNVYIVEGSADITNTVSGESITLIEDQQITATGGILGQVQPLHRGIWENLLSGHGLNPGISDDADNGTTALDIASLGARLEDLRFYESGRGITPVEQRRYANRFSASTVRYVNYELRLTYPETNHDVPFDIEVIWYNPDGGEFSRHTKSYTIQGGWNGSYHTDGVGWEEPGNWNPGIYNVKLFLQGREIADEHFEVTGAGQPVYDIPSLDANVKSLRFFEKGKDFLPVDQRVYHNRFSSSNTRYISWDLYLTYPKQARRRDFIVEAVWYRSDGSEYARMTQNCYQPKGWDESLHNSGWGSETKGTWKPGRYRCELFIQGEKIAEGTIEIIN
ncbi:FecR domain-containing protein [bacterium]|nr:FecR domain-containing protein [bacterium]